MTKPLAGKKIAVVVESQYVPGEVKIYQERFAEYGAEVTLVSRLWGQPSARFYSTVEPGVVDEMEWLEVTTDFADVDLDEYAAVVVTANYTSVRLRWSEREDLTPGNVGEVVRGVPATEFIRRAMENPRIIKGMACHALWLLTPSPDLLAGRHVICNKVVLADVREAGGIYTPCPPGTPPEQQVIIDEDLVTNNSWHASAALVDAVKDQIIDPALGVRCELATPTESEDPDRRRILVLLSEWGYWGEGLVGPLREFDRAGYRVDFCTPNGNRPNAIPVSMNPNFLDPTLQRPITRPEMAAQVREIDDPATEQGKRLEAPLCLAACFPEQPYSGAPAFVHRLQAYTEQLMKAHKTIELFDALFIVGGFGAIVDLANNQRVHDLILAFLKADKPIGAGCYGVTCLAFARDMNLRQSIIRGKHVTGHCREYDYKDGTTFVKSRGEFVDFNMGPPPYPLEYILRDATGPEGRYHGNFGHPNSVIVDYPFITGRSTSDGVLMGQKMIEVLDGDPPLRRWGW